MRPSVAALLGLVSWLACCAPSAADPARSTVLVKVSGEVTAAAGLDGRVWRRSIELRDVEIGSGTGFLISPSGYVLTNHHVVSGGRLVVSVGLEPVVVEMTVRRVQVSRASDDPDRPGDELEATVVATDPAADLAVLFVGAVDWPHLPLGDPSLVAQGDAVAAWGYPLGERLAVMQGGEGRRDLRPSVSGGTVAALHERGAPGLGPDIPYVQTTTPLNPGNSGGPLVDRDGYVVGVVHAKVRGAEGIGFAIGVQEVRAFLERSGLAGELPVRWLWPGGDPDLDRKGIALKVPSGFADQALSTISVDSGDTFGPVRLQVDRVASPWDLETLERELLDGKAFGLPRATPVNTMRRQGAVPGSSRRGAAWLGEGPTRRRMEYAILAVGAEKLVARYEGPADDMVFNAGVLADSLSALDARPLLTKPLTRPLPSRLRPVSPEEGPTPVTSVPAATDLEPGAANPCAGLPSPAGATTAVVEGDFTVRFSATWWPADAAVLKAVQACVGPPGRPRRWTYLGSEFVSEARLVRPAGQEIVLLHLWAPPAKATLALPAFEAWAKAVETGH